MFSNGSQPFQIDLDLFLKMSQKLSGWIFNINTNETKDHNFSKMFVSALKRWLYNSIDPPPIFLCLKEETKSNMEQKEEG